MTDSALDIVQPNHATCIGKQLIQNFVDQGRGDSRAKGLSRGPQAVDQPRQLPRIARRPLGQEIQHFRRDTELPLLRELFEKSTPSDLVQRLQRTDKSPVDSRL